MMARTIRIGIVGIGNMGSAHLSNILDGKIKNASLGAVCDVDREKLEKIKQDDDIRLEAINDLKNILGLKKLERIELYDNSHLFGTYYVGAMAVFKDFLPDKNE